MIRPASVLLAPLPLVLTACAGGASGSAPTVTVTVTATETVTASPAAAPSESASPTAPAAELSPSASPTATLPAEPIESKVKYIGRISPYGAANADQFFELRPTFTNVWNKRIVALKGVMSLTDPFGTEVYSGNWKVTGLRLNPGRSYTQEDFGFTVSGSSGSPGCQGGLADIYGQEGLCRAASDKFRDYTWTFDPESVKFGDGTFWP